MQIRTPLLGGLLGALLGGAFLAAVDHHIGSAGSLVFDSVAAVPARPTALLLGTARLTHGRPNSFYDARIAATARLFHAGKVRAVLVSGDNSRTDYDEPSAMKADLVEAGVPPEYITLDYAGFRTLDSVVRAERVFQQRSFVVVSQRFHCERALYIARERDLDAVGYAAADVGGSPGLRVRAREVAARALAWLDVNLLGTSPRFLGAREPVRLRRPL